MITVGIPQNVPFSSKSLNSRKKTQRNHKLGDGEENWEMMFYYQNMECFGEEWEHLVPNFQLLPGTQQSDRIKAGFHLENPIFYKFPPKLWIFQYLLSGLLLRHYYCPFSTCCLWKHFLRIIFLKWSCKYLSMSIKVLLLQLISSVFQNPLQRVEPSGQ